MRLSFELSFASTNGGEAGEARVLHVRFGTATVTDEHTLPYDEEKLARLSREVIGVLRRGNRARALAEDSLSELRFLGEELHRALIPAALEHELGRGAGPLLLDLDEALVPVPFELLYDGKGFLCRRYALGRSVRSSVPRGGKERRSLGMPPRALVVGVDPRGNLAEVHAECDAIIDVLERERVRARLLGDPSREALRRELKDFDLVHFAGHADFLADDPSASGWHLADGKLTAADIAELAGGRPMPLVIFSNACESGRSFTGGPSRPPSAEQSSAEPSPTGEPPRPAAEPAASFEQEIRRAYGLAGAFLYAGVRHYLGTQWEVIDGHSATFATAFYENLATGQAIGAAVRHARDAVIHAGGEGALAWASYVLYGDPADRPLRRADPKHLSLPSAKDLAARESAPWKRPTPQTMKRVGAELAARHDTELEGPTIPLPVRARPRKLGTTTRALLSGAGVGLLVTAAAAAILWVKRPEVARLAILPIATTSETAAASARVEACLAGALAAEGAPLIGSAQVSALGKTTPVTPEDDARALSLGAALGARWVLWGSVSGMPSVAELHLLEVKGGRLLRNDELDTDDAAGACATEARTLRAALR